MAAAYQTPRRLRRVAGRERAAARRPRRTDVAGFVGLAERGPLHTPVRDRELGAVLRARSAASPATATSPTPCTASSPTAARPAGWCGRPTRPARRRPRRSSATRRPRAVVARRRTQRRARGATPSRSSPRAIADRDRRGRRPAWPRPAGAGPRLRSASATADPDGALTQLRVRTRLAGRFSEKRRSSRRGERRRRRRTRSSLGAADAAAG